MGCPLPDTFIVMSGVNPMFKPPKADRRSERTRNSLITAFDRLLLERGYDDVTVLDIVALADVGRSTFYEQFENKEHMLRESLVPLLAILANAHVHGDIVAVERMIAHMWEQRRLASALLSGSANTLALSLLTELIEEGLRARCATGGGKPRLPLRLVAVQIAAVTIAPIVSWLDDSTTCTSADIARAIILGSRAIIAAKDIPAS